MAFIKRWGPASEQVRYDELVLVTESLSWHQSEQVYMLLCNAQAPGVTA